MRILLLALLRLYKFTISPCLGNRCRFYPTCSDYAYEAICQYGVVRGSYMAAKRVCRCHPFSAGGIDVVPPLGLKNLPTNCLKGRQSEEDGAKKPKWS